MATSLNNLGHLYHSQDRYTEAEPLHLEAINIFREGLGENHPHTVVLYCVLLQKFDETAPNSGVSIGPSNAD